MYSATAEYNGLLSGKLRVLRANTSRGETFIMSKKIIAALLALAMTAGLAACGGTPAEEGSAAEDSGTTSQTTSADETSDTGDTGDDGAADGSGAWIPSSELEDDAAPGENDDRAFKKFDEVVEVTFGQQVDPVDTTLPEGDSVDDNQYTRYLEENYNIKYVMEWTAGNASDFRQKLSLGIASATLPDSVLAPDRNYLVQAARATCSPTCGRPSTRIPRSRSSRSLRPRRTRAASTAR